MLYGAIPEALAGQWGEACYGFDPIDVAAESASPEGLARLRTLLEKLWQGVQEPEAAGSQLARLISDANALFAADSPMKLGGWNGFKILQCGTPPEIVANPDVQEFLREQAEDYDDADAGRLLTLAESGQFNAHDPEHLAQLEGFFEEYCKAHFC